MNAITAGVFLAFASNSAAHPATDCKVSDFGTLPVDMTGEQATTIVKVNGENTRFILDTGAFFNSMSKANADALQLRREAAPFGLRGSGIGGDFSLQVARIKEFGILGTSLRDIEFLVGGSDIGMPLIGANLLDFADLDIDLARGKLRMMKAQGRDCDRASMAYWAKNGDYEVVELRRLDNPNDRRSFVTVFINGKPVKALLDTGAYATLLTRKAANSAGIDLDSPGVESSYITYGLGTKGYKTWTAPVDTFTVGTETIQHSKMQVFDGTISDDYTEMLLGVDFFLAHHLFIANSQHKVYFTYNGGRVFTLAKPPGQSASPQTSPGDDKDTPKNADDLARLGQAHLSRGESAAALADLDEAIRLAPNAANYLVRARVHLILDQLNAALADLDKSL
jgi:predicted aspartyl protease